MSKQLAKMPRAEQWADRICTQLGKSVEAIIETGRLLLKAKDDLDHHGEWGRMFADELIPISHRTADFYMAIATHTELSNSKNFSNLPPVVSTLYTLAKKADQTKLKKALKDGVITPDMSRKAVVALLPAAVSKQKTRPIAKASISEQSVVEHDAPEIRCYFAVEAEIQRVFYDLDHVQRCDLVGRLRQLVEELEQETNIRTSA